jgi:hypothetical protein
VGKKMASAIFEACFTVCLCLTFPSEPQTFSGASALERQEYGGKSGTAHIVFFVYNMPVWAFAAIFLCAVLFMMRTCEHDKQNAAKRSRLQKKCK